MSKSFSPFDKEIETKRFQQALAYKLMAESWQQIRNYIRDNHKLNGITEFRISMQDDDHFIIHPLGKDGETINMRLSGIPYAKNKA